MFESMPYPSNKADAYELLYLQAKALFADVNNNIANLANASALLNGFLDQINWVGFYLYDSHELVLGPFQGKPACVKIGIGKGVCGTSFEQERVLVVPNVHEFPGHIACDEASRSEIVIPLYCQGQLIGVLDIDSPIFNRFEEEKEFLEKFVVILQEYLIP